MRPVRIKTDYVVWHCSASGPSRDIGAADIDTMHKARGWEAIGYALVIRRNGRVEVGEDLKRYGAHAAGYNARSVGVCLVGGVDESGKSVNNFTPEQWASAKKVYDFLSLVYPEADHVGHRDLSPDKDGNGVIDSWEFMKDCPCFSVAEWEKGGLAPLLPVSKDAVAVVNEIQPYPWLSNGGGS
jgi:N-acetylmuramoyl-L-alanine amidase